MAIAHMNLNDEQRAAVESAADNTLVIAGAGSGKSGVLANRIAWRIAQGAKAENIVAITYTNAAAQVLRDRVDALLQKDGEVGVGYLSARPMAIGFVGTIHAYALRVLQRDGQTVGLPERVGVMDEEQAEELLEETMASLHYKGTRKDVDAAVAERLRTRTPVSRTGAELAAFEFVDRMHRDGALSFDAVIAFATACLTCKAAGPIFRELFVDEYQDTSDLTHGFVMAHPGTKFFVADFDQAIFGWNGGNVSNVLGLLSDCEWTTFRLNTNYRSTPRICEAANVLIAHNKRRAPKAMHSAQASIGAGPAVEFRQFPNAAAELAFVADAIAKSPVHDSECAVLCRTNALREAATAFLEAGGISVHRRAERVLPPDWGAARAFVASCHAYDNDTLAYWWLKTAWGITQANVFRAEAAKAGTSINRSMERPVVTDVTAIPRIMVAFKKQFRFSLETVQAVTELVAALPPSAGLPELAGAMAAAGGDVQESGQGVIVSTIHSFKGREASVVFLVGFDDDIIPGNATGADLEEMRRLAYVGVTRAKERLIITTAAERKAGPWMPRPQPATPSRFIAEMGGRL